MKALQIDKSILNKKYKSFSNRCKIADKIGLTPQGLRYRLSDKSKLNAQQITELCRALDLEVEHVVSFKEVGIMISAENSHG